MVKKDKENQ